MLPGLSKCISQIQNTLLRGNRFLEEDKIPKPNVKMDYFKATKFGQPFARFLYLMANKSVMFHAMPCDFETGHSMPRK